MCKAIHETTTHLVSVCPKHLQKEYKQQLDWMGKTAYWNICRKKGLNIPKKWHENKPLPCAENESYKIICDLNIQTGNIIEHSRPGMIIIDKTSKKAQVIDFAVPADHRTEISQQRKIENYQDLKCELQKLRNLKISRWSIVIGALTTIPKSLKNTSINWKWKITSLKCKLQVYLIVQELSGKSWSSKGPCWHWNSRKNPLKGLTM